MPFNPSHTFQKNRRFWMAAILMLCMVTFVFCTGRGDMPSWISKMFRSGNTIANVGGHSVTSQELYELKMQRNVANEFMRNCVEIGFKKISKIFYETERNTDEKNLKARQQTLFKLHNIRTTLYERKSRPRYFDLGVKFDDLLEFKLWQAVADKLGIQLDEEHVRTILNMELYSSNPNPRENLLDYSDLFIAQREVKRNFQNINDAFLQRAIAEEFRVRIAQEAVLTAQPLQRFSGRGQDGMLSMKFSNSEMPDEIRAPLTLAQLWDAWKKDCSDFTVTLVPVKVDEFVKEIKEVPTEESQRDYFTKNKDKPADPSAEERGMTLPLRIKIEYVTADPTSKEYLGVARAVELLKVVNPIDLEVVQSPIAAASAAMARAQQHRADMQLQYNQLAQPVNTFDFRASAYSQPAAAPILTWFAKRHPEAIASMIGAGFNGPANDLGTLAGYMAWGAAKNPQEVEISLKAEADRRAPDYASIIGNGAANPYAALSSYFALDNVIFDPRETSPAFQYFVIYPRLPVDAIMQELEKKVAARAAEEAVQQNMQAMRTALEKVNGDQDKYRRVLNQMVPELNLTYGPAKKDEYFSRYSVDEAKSLAPLRESYLKYLTPINFYEARDMKPETLLKPGDFQKLFFDSSEAFCASSPYQVMSWPPKARPSSSRIWKAPDARLIDPKQIRREDLDNFQKQIGQSDPLKAIPEIDMFKDAEKPILFWRTAQRVPERPADFADIDRNIKKYQADAKRLGEEVKKMEKLSADLAQLHKDQLELKKAKGKDAELEQLAKKTAELAVQLQKMQRTQGDAATLRSRRTDLKEKEADLEEIRKLIVEGWRFERARSEKALPRAKSIAEEFLNNLQKTKLQIAHDESAKLHEAPIFLSDLAPMTRVDLADNTVDYFKPSLPKDKIPFARDDMMDQVIQLYGLKQPIKIDNKAIDDINKMLFEKAQTGKKNDPLEFVQIFTNKPRSAFYVGVVTEAPRRNQADFVDAMKGAYNLLMEPDPFAPRRIPRNHFAERIQQQAARQFRANVVAYLGATLGFDVVNKDARQGFDDRSGSD